MQNAWEKKANAGTMKCNTYAFLPLCLCFTGGYGWFIYCIGGAHNVLLMCESVGIDGLFRGLEHKNSRSIAMEREELFVIGI